ncbi:hypothetical protein BGC07_04675 [Piscirickettsia litoralis]|uniref:DSP-PTPase phosphatase fused to NAD+ Kinase domain-containing protein n=2 Tax=Piscirickettsia litoralis TaxID=1891921 RepID=A0ABX3A4J9_9GAMM|nr:hypothetical protein BGC07_04675 [Piscirickettsia litoralis]
MRFNTHAVISHEIYRSAELSKKQFAAIIQQNHLKSIINLRGAQLNQTWYQNEIAISKHFDVKHYDLHLPPNGLPTLHQLKALITLIQDAPKPLLLHCRASADRTGLASAISLILFTHDSINTVLKQISWHYLVFAPDSIGKMVMPLYINWLNQHNKINSRKNFLHWIQQLQAL